MSDTTIRISNKQAQPSHEPGRVPSQVPSADLEKRFYQHYKLWNRRAA